MAENAIGVGITSPVSNQAKSVGICLRRWGQLRSTEIQSPLHSLSIDIADAIEKAELEKIERVILNLYKRRFSTEDIEELTELSADEVDNCIAEALEKVADTLGRNYFDSV